MKNSSERWVVGIVLAGLMIAIVSTFRSSAEADEWRAKEASASKAIAAQVRGDIESLIGHCKANNVNKAAAFVVYRGRDKARRWQDVSDATQMEDRVRVESVCRQINALLEGSTGQTFADFRTESESEGVWHLWKIRFDGSSPQERVFAMLKVKGHFALGDID